MRINEYGRMCYRQTLLNLLMLYTTVTRDEEFFCLLR